MTVLGCMSPLLVIMIIIIMMMMIIIIHSFLGLLGIDSLNLYILQKTALSETATIFKKVLQLSGCG